MNDLIDKINAALKEERLPVKDSLDALLGIVVLLVHATVYKNPQVPVDLRAATMDGILEQCKDKLDEYSMGIVQNVGLG